MAMQDPPTTVPFAPEERAKFRRLNTEQAINLARQSKWDEAVEVNERLIHIFPNDADALNRLGKALTELGRYPQAVRAYERTLAADPTNSIAQKNVARLRTLKDEGATAPVQQRYDPALFIEEPGKTAVTTLVNLASTEALAPLAAGDQLSLHVNGSVIEVRDLREQMIGQLEPKITLRLLPLLTSGNQYAAAITAIDGHQVRAIIRETYQHPDNSARVSFPTSVGGGEGVRPYTRDSVLRYDLEDDDDEFGEDGDFGTEEGASEEAEGGDVFEEEPEQ
ncbi:MAG TPA: tetratricopeptide repeat protein [Chloroflexota bacterium]|nr:tetratricopeptide repeat protein [Chloroflexota bacterium]